MQDLTNGHEGKLIFRFAAPMLIGNIFQQLFNVVDSVVVGNFIGKEALAAVGASFPIIFMLISLIIGLVMGITVVISQYFGAKDYVRVKRAIDTMYIYTFFAGDNCHNRRIITNRSSTASARYPTGNNASGDTVYANLFFRNGYIFRV